MTNEKKFEFIIDCIFYGTIAAIIYIILKYAVVYLLPFLIGFLLVYTMQKPAIILSSKTKINKNIITILIIVAAMSAICAALFFICRSLVTLGYEFCTESSFVDDAKGLLNSIQNSVPKYLSVYFNNIITSSIKYLSNTVFSGIKNAIVIIPEFLISSAVAIVSTVFFAFYYDRFIIFIKKQLEDRSVSFVKKLKKTVNNSIILYVKGYLIMLLITFAQMLLGLSIIGVKNATGLAAIIAFVDLLPVFGTGSVLIPWGIIEIISGNTVLGIEILALYLIYSFLRYFTEPRVIGKKVGLNPLISLFAMFIGLKLFGFLGLVLLPLLCAIISVLNENDLIHLYKQ